ncbi:hypothetical protein C1590_005041 [Escherichia coli]|nr:hypothetical protein [Escherichia coli]
MKIKHEHIESVLLALAAEKGQAWVANAITEEYLRQGGGELPLVPGKDWNNQQNIYHRWLKGETNAQREKIQKLIPAVLAILPRELRHRLCIFDTLERRALLAAQEALSTAIDAHDDAVQAVYPDIITDDYKTTFYQWRREFTATWQELVEESPDKRRESDSKVIQQAIALFSAVSPQVDPENRAALAEWLASLVNATQTYGEAPLIIDVDALANYEPPKQETPDGNFQPGGEEEETDQDSV